jgi:hypothetical protein
VDWCSIQITACDEALHDPRLRGAMHTGPSLELSVAKARVVFVWQESLHWLYLWDTTKEVGEAKESFNGCRAASGDMPKDFPRDGLSPGFSVRTGVLKIKCGLKFWQ